MTVSVEALCRQDMRHYEVNVKYVGILTSH